MTAVLSARRAKRFTARGEADAALGLAWGAATDVGLRRAANEDSFVAVAGLFAVADGLGGHSAGDVASDIAVRRLAAVARSRSRGTGLLRDGDVEEALVAAGAEILEATAGAEWGSGTTVCGLAVVAQRDAAPALQVFNIGDSRAYSFRHGILRQITVDHSFVQELVDSGQLRPEEAEYHPDANVITRALGFGETPAIDSWIIRPRQGTRFLVCTDGLTRELPAGVIAAFLNEGADPQRTARALVSAAVAAGGRDNVTVVIVDVLDAPPDASGEPERGLADGA